MLSCDGSDGLQNGYDHSCVYHSLILLCSIKVCTIGCTWISLNHPSTPSFQTSGRELGILYPVTDVHVSLEIHSLLVQGGGSCQDLPTQDHGPIRTTIRSTLVGGLCQLVDQADIIVRAGPHSLRTSRLEVHEVDEELCGLMALSEPDQGFLLCHSKYQFQRRRQVCH